jgi:hypothetical protein
MVRYVASMGEMRNAHESLVEKSGGKRQIGKPRRRWKDTSNMHTLNE